MTHPVTLRPYVRLLNRNETAGWQAVARDLPALGLEGAEAVEIRGEIKAQLRRLVAVTRCRDRGPRRRTEPKPDYVKRPPGPCYLKGCPHPWPHDTTAWRTHGRITQGYHGFKHSPIGKVGYRGGPDRCHELAVLRKMAIFRQVCPQQARVLGDAGIRDRVLGLWPAITERPAERVRRVFRVRVLGIRGRTGLD